MDIRFEHSIILHSTDSNEITGARNCFWPILTEDDLILLDAREETAFVFVHRCDLKSKFSGLSIANLVTLDSFPYMRVAFSFRKSPATILVESSKKVAGRKK